MKHKEMTAGERTAYGQGYRAAEKKIIKIFKNKTSQTIEDFLRVLDLALQNGDEFLHTDDRTRFFKEIL